MGRRLFTLEVLMLSNDARALKPSRTTVVGREVYRKTTICQMGVVKCSLQWKKKDYGAGGWLGKQHSGQRNEQPSHIISISTRWFVLVIGFFLHKKISNCRNYYSGCYSANQSVFYYNYFLMEV